jgi:hypothetical protein
VVTSKYVETQSNRLLENFLAEQRKYVDATVSVTPIGTIDTAVGTVPVYGYRSKASEMNLLTLYRERDGGVRTIGFCIHEPTTFLKPTMVNYLAKLYGARAIGGAAQ